MSFSENSKLAVERQIIATVNIQLRDLVAYVELTHAHVILCEELRLRLPDCRNFVRPEDDPIWF